MKYVRLLFVCFALLSFSLEGCANKGIPCPKTAGKKTKGKKIKTVEGQATAGEVTTGIKVNHDRKTGLVKKKKYNNLKNKPNKRQYQQR